MTTPLQNLVTADYPGGTQDFDPSKANALTEVQLSAVQALVQGAWNVGLNAITSPPRIPTVGAIGDSIILNMTTSQSGSLGGYVGVQRRPDQRYAWIHWACAYSGICMPDIYAFEGFSGKKTDEILAACTTASATETVGASDTIAIGTQARTPDIVVDMSGTNDLGLATLSDLTTGAALSRCIAGRVAIWNFIKQCGGRPIALSLLPRQGSYVTPSGLTQAALGAAYVPAWNTALKAAAVANNVPWVDGFSACASGAVWKPYFIQASGSDDVFGVHPSLLASQAIGQALSAILVQVAGTFSSVPRIQLGTSPIYSAAFIASDKRQFFANFDSGVFPSLSGWALNYDPNSNSSFSLTTPTQDTAGGGTFTGVKPANTVAGGLARWQGPALTVAAGQTYILFFDYAYSSADSNSTFAVQICDNTSASPSLNQPLAYWTSFTGCTSGAFAQPVVRVALFYRVPTSINSVRVFIIISRAVQGAAGVNDTISVSNVGQIRLT